MPAVSSAWTSCGPSYMLKMITRDWGDRFLISLTVVVTSAPGISTSSRTISGFISSTSAIVVSLSLASPTTRRSLCVSRISRRPSRTSVWSSTRRIVMRSALSVIGASR
jgi:hypothetical protein